MQLLCIAIEIIKNAAHTTNTLNSHTHLSLSFGSETGFCGSDVRRHVGGDSKLCCLNERSRTTEGFVLKSALSCSLPPSSGKHKILYIKKKSVLWWYHRKECRPLVEIDVITQSYISRKKKKSTDKQLPESSFITLVNTILERKCPNKGISPVWRSTIHLLSL